MKFLGRLWNRRPWRPKNTGFAEKVINWYESPFALSGFVINALKVSAEEYLSDDSNKER